MPRVGKTMDRKATRRRMAAEAGSACGKCGKPGHVPKDCKVTWRKAWPGQYVTKLGIRYPDGSAVEVILPLSEDLGKRLQHLMLEAIGQPDPPATVPA